jgi:excisionase family DNA binding protein
MIEMPEMLTPEQVAVYLQVNKKTIYRFIREGKLPAVRLGRHYRVSGENLGWFLRAQATAAIPAQMTDDHRDRKQVMLDAIARLTALRAKIKKDMGGHSFASVLDIVDEARRDLP